MTTCKPENRRLRALIIGGGVAGTTCAATLATHHPEMSITLVDPAPGIKIATTISKITSSTHDINITTQTPESWCEKHGIRFRQGLCARLTRDAVHFFDGSMQEFDVCCVATGARPVIPEGLRGSRFEDFVYMLRDTDSVDRLKKKLKDVKRVMVIGGGGIAMEVVYALVDCEVFWVVKGHIGGSFFDARLGALLAGVGDVAVREGKSLDDGYSENNVEVRKSRVIGSGVGPDWLGRRDGPLLIDENGAMIDDIGDGRLRGCGERKHVKFVNGEVRKLDLDMNKTGVEAHVSDGSRIWCDMIIVGAGVTPNTEWLSSSTVKLNAEDGGVITKCGSMETSTRRVYAAGDCTHMIQGGKHWSQMRVWSQAFVAGRAAGLEMGRVAGGDGYAGLEFEVFAHATKFFGRKVVLLGRFDGCGEVYERIDDDEYLRVVVSDGSVVGAVLVGDVDCGEVFENLIISGLDVGFLGERIVEKEVALDEFFD